mmetsp:Transcript_964/g.1554  ORF Transcript_964/g.1554 Transcript_964/m.1554 type:complete len:685 (+) Transcript_964:34-2088(+)
MSRAAPASAAGVHLMQQSRKRPVSKQEVAAFDPHITIESMERIIKSSSAVENLVTNLVGQKMGQEKEQVKPTPVDSKCFQNFIYCTIMLNALTLGLQADLQSGGWTLVWFVFENLFTTIFAVEMVIKIYFLQMGYFWNAKPRRPQYWNLLDFVIALLAIVDCWILTYQTNADAPAIRVMQLLRIIRIAKLLRLRQELVAIIEGLFSSLQCMVWIGFLLLIVIYGFSIVCRNVMGNLTNSDFEDMINNEMYFGSLPRTMLTLFNICLIDSWGAIIWPQMLYNPWMVIPLVVFMSVTCFGLMNALIGVIVERTTAAQQSMSSMQEEAVREMKMYMVAQLLEAIDDSDEDRSGTINLQEFREVQRKPHAAEIFAALNLPPGFEAKDLFSLLDSDGNGQLDRYEFLLGICRLIWCDEFQSQCLQNHAISLVREDIRSLQATVKDLSDKCQVQGSPPDDAEMLKSISETLRNDYQEVLNSCLEKYWERAKELLEKDAEKKRISLSNQTAPEKIEKVQERRQKSDDSAVPACERVAEKQCDGTTGAALDDALNRAEVLLHTHCVPTPEEFQIQLPMEMLETVERLLDELVAASGALQLSLRADGILLVEGCSKARDCVGRIIRELAESGWSPLLEPGRNAPPDSGDETSSQPDDFRDQNAEGIKKGRRKPRRAKKAKVPKQHELVAEPQP